MSRTGELNPKTTAALFAGLYAERLSGVAYFRNPQGQTVFVSFLRGLAQHASGECGEGDAAIKTVLAWTEGEYRFMDDVRPDPDDFLPNISSSFAAALGGGERIAAEGPFEDSGPPLPILAVGDSMGVVAAAKATEAAAVFPKTAFTGCWALGPAEMRIGFLLYRAGVVAGALTREGKLILRGEEAREAFDGKLLRSAATCEFLKAGEETAQALQAALKGKDAIARMPAAALNIDEYLQWAGDFGLTGVLSAIKDNRVGNIYYCKGKLLGAAATPGCKLSNELDKVLELIYAPGATIEVLAA